jgi:uncharacterized protein (DUF1697 family)
MGRLKTVAEELGGMDVETYLRSGNVILTVPRKRVAGLAGAFETACVKAFGFEIPVMVRTGAEMAAVVDHNPFPLDATSKTTLHVAFLAASPAADAFTGLPADEGEELRVVGRELYVHLPSGLGRSKLATSLGRRKEAAGTMRNWATVVALASRTAG